MLTDDQCDRLRRLPLSFNDMVRAIHALGQRSALIKAAGIFDGTTEYDDWVAADGYANGLDISAELKFMAGEVSGAALNPAKRNWSAILNEQDEMLDYP